MISEGRSKPHKRSFRGVARVFGYSIIILAVAVGAVMIGSAFQVIHQFGAISFPQMLMNLPGFGGGEAEVAPGLVEEFITRGVIIPLVIVAALCLVAGFSLVRGAKRGARRGPVKTVAVLTAVASLGAGYLTLDRSIGFSAYFFGDPQAESLADYYAEPKLDKPIPGDKNLILIYLESMDDAFGDETLVGTNALESLQDATDGWGQIGRYTQNPALGGWTMAGIVATQCGIPIRPPEGVALSNDESDDLPEFLPGTKCLGDYLDEAGYRQVFLSGADQAFAGKGSFLRTHGFDEVKDRNYWREQGETEFSAWGLSDRRLFARAREEALALRASGEPFVLSMLTVDNHAPVYEAEYCPRSGIDPFLDAVACQSDLAADYINFLNENGFMNDSVVVVIGDHQVLPSYDVAQYREQLPEDQADIVPVFNRFWSPQGPIEFARDNAHQIDLFPTLLELLGAEVANGRGGVGVSLFVPEGDARTIGTVLPMSDAQLADLLGSPSPGFYERMWGLDEKANASVNGDS